MKCEYCENEVPAGASRCPSCGAVISPKKEAQQDNQAHIIVVRQAPNVLQPTVLSAASQSDTYLLADQKSRAVYVIIGFLFGEFGIHDFYAGYNGRGIAQLLITILSFGLLFWVSWIWAAVEMLTVERDAKGVPFK